MQVNNKKIVMILHGVIVAIIFVLCFWCLTIDSSMVVQRDPFTNLFIFLHLLVSCLLGYVWIYHSYIYYKTRKTDTLLTSLLSFILGSIGIYFSIKNITNSSLIIYPNSHTYIQDIHYLSTVNTIESIALCSMVLLSIVVFVVSLHNYKKYNY